ncbi:ATP-binding cassette subfamily B protein [Laceyella sediminis]|uniref:ATP-binding cassette subfamily B protein n=1 Tax=Laceyella sediminis TaxID=573074 RepID=A0ABX5EMR5_9BACL|nr:ABC transporter ATP-binding protein [Laceyella sediminis]PRZ12369.1 ATP-binding cassette subfamily B protein [Laceyella sediminis]
MNQIQMRTLLLPYWKLILLSTLISLLGVGAHLLNPLIMKQMIDVALPRKEYSLILLSAGGLVLLPIVSTILEALSKVIHNKIGGEITDKLNHQLFRHLLRLSPRTLNEFHSGDIAIRMDRVEDIGDGFVKWNLLPMPTEILSLIGIVIIMLQLDFVLALVAFFMFPIVVVTASYLGRKIETNFTVIMDLNRKLQSYAVQLYGGMKTVQLLTREEEERSAQKEKIGQYRGIRNDTFLIQKWRYELLSSLEKALGLAVLFSVSIWLILKGQMTIGTLLAFTVYFPNFLGTAKAIRSAYMQYREVKPMLKEVEEVLNLPVEIVPSTQSVPLKQASGEIEFRQVSFSYKPKRGNIHNVSFHIQPGEFIGVVGPTGAGKSTILDLLLRFYDPDQGEILLDGRNIKEYTLYDLRNRIGLVTQDVFLWDKTIKENLLYANPEATMDELIHACNIAQVT